MYQVCLKYWEYCVKQHRMPTFSGLHAKVCGWGGGEAGKTRQLQVWLSKTKSIGVYDRVPGGWLSRNGQRRTLPYSALSNNES